MQSPVLLLSHCTENSRDLNNKFIEQIKKTIEINKEKEEEKLTFPASLSQGAPGFIKEMIDHWSKSISDFDKEFDKVIDYSFDYCNKESMKINEMTPKLRVCNSSFNLFYIKKYKLIKRKKNRFLSIVSNKRKKDITKIIIATNLIPIEVPNKLN